LLTGHVAASVGTYGPIDGEYESLGGGYSTPGGRAGAYSWIDNEGTLFLFGGKGYSSVAQVGYLNDLWMYYGSSWYFLGGSTTNSNQSSFVYSQGVEAAANWPGVRSNGFSFTADVDRLFLYGGVGIAGNQLGKLNQLWVYERRIGVWNWLSGSDEVNLLPSSSDAGGRSDFSGFTGSKGTFIYGGEFNV
jgi:hypothetical protein